MVEPSRPEGQTAVTPEAPHGRLLRRMLIAVLGILIILGILCEVGRRYLQSRHVAAQVARRLEASYGGHVEVGSLDVGFGGSSVHDVHLFEKGEGGTATPWAVIPEARTDLTLWDLLRGRTSPHHLTLDGAAITLRFDKDGHLLTQIPRSTTAMETVPEVDLEHGRVSLLQEGRPPMVVSSIDGKVSPEGSRLVLSGRVSDPFWKSWTVNAVADRQTMETQATLKTAGLHVTQEMLNDLPFISRTVWQEVQLEGDTPVEFQSRLEAEAKAFHYRVAVEPKHAHVHVTAIDLTAAEAHGQVVVDDAIAHLKDVQGQVAGGQLTVAAADLNFRDTPEKLDFEEVRCRDLDVSQLPKSWSLPPQVTGRLTGEAHLQLTLLKDRTVTSGEGAGVINDARVGGQPAEPIRLKLHATRKGYEFASAQPLVPRRGDGVLATVGSPTLPTATEIGFSGLAGLMLPDLQAPAAEPATEEQFLPAWAADRAVDLVRRGAEAAGRAAHEVMSRLPKMLGGPPRPPAAAPRYLEVNLAMHDVDLEQFVHGLQLNLPFPLQGRATFRVRAAFPLDTPKDPKTYRANGSATLPWVVVDSFRIEQVEARVAYADGVLRLEELRGRIPAAQRPPSGPPPSGQFDGTARLQLVPAGDLSARLKLKDIPLTQVLSLTPGVAKQVEGTFSGAVEISAPAAKLKDVDSWVASGNLTADRIRAYGQTLEKASLAMRLKDGTLAVTNLGGNLEQTPLRGSGELRLKSPYRYQAKLAVEKINLTALNRLSPDLRPLARLEGSFGATADVQGTLQPFTVQASGSAHADDLRVSGVKIARLAFRWTSQADHLTVSDLSGLLDQGKLSGSADVPLRRTVSGKVELRFQDVDVGALEKDFPAIPIRLEGRASGSIEGTLPAAAAGKEREFAAHVDLRAPGLRVQGVPTEQLQGTLNYREGKLDYHLQGKSLGGTFDLDGQLPSAEPAPAEPEREGRLRVQEVELARLWPALDITALKPLSGRINLEMTFSHRGPARTLAGGGQVIVTRLRWGQAALAGTLRSDILITAEDVRLRNLSGVVGQGVLRGQVAFNFQDFSRSSFNVALDRAEASRLLAPWPFLAARVQGPVAITLRGRLGRTWTGTGQAGLTQGKILGVDVAEWRVPLDWVVVPGRGVGQVEIRDSAAQLARGRATGRASFRWGVGTRLEGQVRLYQADLQALLRQATESTTIGPGQISGRVDFTGTDLRSLSDVDVTVDAQLTQMQPAQLPVIGALVPYLRAGGASSASSNGDLRAHLDRGIFRIERLTLELRQLPLFIRGTVTLQGRLDLDVTANNRPREQTGLVLRLLGFELPLNRQIPANILKEVTALLVNQLVHLHMTGTVRNPVVQVEPLPVLTEGALRFFTGAR